MPGIFHQPIHRRSFLRWSGLGVATIVTLGRGLAQSAERPAALHLALLSDTHIPADRMNGHRGFNPWENLRRVVPDVVAARPEGVILCGDAARLEGRPGDYVELKSLLEPVASQCPVYIGLGNHDDRDQFRNVFSPPTDSAPDAGGKHVLVLEHEAVRAVVLDSLLYVNRVAGLLGKAQRDWLARWLATHDDRPVVLFVHHTLEDRDGDLLDADRLFDLLRPYPQVKAIFYGHSHVWEQRQHGRLKLINLPAVGYNFSDQQPVGWVDSVFHPKGVDLTLQAIGGNTEGSGRKLEIRWS